MRIAIVSTPFIRVPPDGYGGTELFCATLAAELCAAGHEVTLFATGDSTGPGEVRALFPRACWPPSQEDDLAHVRWSLEQIADAPAPFDVTQLNSALGLSIARELSLPVVYTLHHARMEPLSAIYAQEREAHYVAISARQLALEVHLPAATVIHHGLDPSGYRPSARDLGYVLHLGRFCEEKGTHVAIDAAGLAGVPILLAGRCQPFDRAWYEREIVPRAAKPGVELVGEANHPRKVALLAGARALLCPVQWEEPFGLAAIEAMLCGTPVIAYARGSFPEIVDPGVTGLLAASTHEIARAIEQARHMDRAACATRARQRFSASRMAGAYATLFEKVAARDAPREVGLRASGA